MPRTKPVDSTKKDQTSLVDRVKKAAFGDAENEEITSGTLAVTRATGVLVVGLVGVFAILDAAGWDAWDNLGVQRKFWIALGLIFCWAVIAAADAVARGIASSNPDSIGVVVTKANSAEWVEAKSLRS